MSSEDRIKEASERQETKPTWFQCRNKHFATTQDYTLWIAYDDADRWQWWIYQKNEPDYENYLKEGFAYSVEECKAQAETSLKVIVG